MIYYENDQNLHQETEKLLPGCDVTWRCRMFLFQVKRDILYVKNDIKYLFLNHIKSALSNGGSIVFFATSL